MAQRINNPPAMQETQETPVLSLCPKDPLEEENQVKTTFQEGVWIAAEKQGESRSQGESRWLCLGKKEGW